MSTSDRHAPGLRRNQSLQRGAALLEALADRPDGASAAALARATELPRPTAGRLLATLADLGLVQRLPASDDWVLGPAIARLGRAADPFGHVVRIARPHLEALAEETGESACLNASPTPTTAEVVAQADASRLVGITGWVGKSFPLHASAAGKLALAALPPDALDAYLAVTPLPPITPRTITSPEAFRRHLATVRAEGVATSRDELEDGLTGVGVPVAVAPGTPLLTVAIGGPSARFGPERDAELLVALRTCAERVAAALR